MESQIVTLSTGMLISLGYHLPRLVLAECHGSRHFETCAAGRVSETRVCGYAEVWHRARDLSLPACQKAPGG